VNFGGYTKDLPLTTESGVWYMVFGKHAFFGYVIDTSGGVVWFANVPRSEISKSEREAMSAQQWKRGLLDLFKDDYSQIAEIIAAGDLELVADNTYDLPTVPAWSRGRIIVIGDAAHAPSPSSGQGASTAMEDGANAFAILRACLRPLRLTSTSAGLASSESLPKEPVKAATRHSDPLAGR
jgi:2-polyprenyl-6-methoxyphenol hydroxylase-like FAD-dependent oxidoreductase